MLTAVEDDKAREGFNALRSGNTCCKGLPPSLLVILYCSFVRGSFGGSVKFSKFVLSEIGSYIYQLVSCCSKIPLGSP